MNMPPQIRKIIIIAIAAIIIIVAATTLFNILTTTEVTIKTNDKSAKVVIGNTTDPDVATRFGTATVRLKPDTYTVRVTKDGQETRGLLVVKLGQPKAVELNLVPLKGSEYVAPYAANYLRATKDTVKFINNSYNQLIQIPAAGGTSQFINSGEFTRALWVDDTKAYVQDTAGDYYFLDGAQATILPFPIDSDSLSTTNSGAIAYTYGQTVFMRPSAFADPSVQFDVKALQPIVSLGSQDHLLVYDVGIGSDSSIDQAPPQIFKAGKKNDAASDLIKTLVVAGAAWSPDGNKLAVSASEGLYVLDLTANTLNLLYEQPPDNPESIVWSDANTLLYFLEGLLWQVKTGETTIWTKLAHVNESVGFLGPLTLAPDRKIYYSTNNARLQGTIFRVTLE